MKKDIRKMMAIFVLVSLFVVTSLWGETSRKAVEATQVKKKGGQNLFFSQALEECLARRIRDCIRRWIQKFLRRNHKVQQALEKWGILEKCPLLAPTSVGKVGLLVLAHGGSREWNLGIHNAVRPLKKYLPTEVAFGMARADTIQQAVQKLEAQGVRKIVVIRLFLSPFTFRKRMEMILGLRPGAPPKPKVHRRMQGHHSMPFWRILSKSSFRMNRAGLLNSPLVDQILVDRAKELSKNPKREVVLLLAHGMGSMKQNAYWLSQMAQRTRLLRELGFAKIQVEVLSEDWPRLRRKAEQRIRSIVQQELAKGRKVLVIPFRVYGFGPYKQVLKGIKYVANGRGLIPHPLVTRWIRLEAERVLREAGWPNPFSKVKK